jgi:hypothetical protein
MRIRMLLTSAAVLTIVGASAASAAPRETMIAMPAATAAMHAPMLFALAIQDPQPPTQPQPQTSKGDVKVDINTTTTRSWYADPFWIGLGVVALVVVVLLIALAGRGGGSSTTVVR